MANEAVDLESLRQDIEEGTEYFIVGIIMPPKQRYAERYRAASARQAEDLAGLAVRENVVNGEHGELWVAGVFELIDGEIACSDNYAKYVDPDEAD